MASSSHKIKMKQNMIQKAKYSKVNLNTCKSQKIKSCNPKPINKSIFHKKTIAKASHNLL